MALDPLTDHRADRAERERHRLDRELRCATLLSEPLQPRVHPLHYPALELVELVTHQTTGDVDTYLHSELAQLALHLTVAYEQGAPLRVKGMCEASGRTADAVPVYS